MMNFYNDLIRKFPGELFFFHTPTNLRHAQNVAWLSVALAGPLGCPDQKIRQIYRGGRLHDIGKQSIPDKVLNKSGSLTPDEVKLLQKHPEMGYDFLARYSSDSVVLNMVLYHHEWWDGSGYPHGLKGEEIPLEARICAVADVWDALITDRCYRSAWEKPKALDMILAGMGSHYDPQVVMEFVKLVEEGQMVRTPAVRPVGLDIIYQHAGRIPLAAEGLHMS